MKRTKEHYQFLRAFSSPANVIVLQCRSESITNEHSSCCNNVPNTFFLYGPIARKVWVGYINLLYGMLQVFKSPQLFWHFTASHTPACLKTGKNIVCHVDHCHISKLPRLCILTGHLCKCYTVSTLCCFRMLRHHSEPLWEKWGNVENGGEREEK